MKKTKKTMITSALLSAAVALQTQTVVSTGSFTGASTVYGPPPGTMKTGDINKDGKIDILDYIFVKASMEDNVELSGANYDMNQDSEISPEDIQVFQKYLFGKIPDMEKVYPKDYDDNPSVTEPEVTPAVTDVTTTSELIQHKYGPFPAISDITTTIPQTKYGPFPVISDITTTSELLQPKYGPFPVTTEDDYPVQSDSDTPAVTDVPETDPMPVFSEVEQVVYGPPSYFESLNEDDSK